MAHGQQIGGGWPVDRLTTVKKRVFLPVVVSASLVLTGCTQGMIEQGEEQMDTMGNAEPVASPEAADPAGEVIDFDPIQDIDLVPATRTDTEIKDGGLGVRAGDKLLVGDIDMLTSGNARETAIDPDAADISANAGKFAVARADHNEVELIDPAAPSNPNTIVPVGDDVTVAAPLFGGGIIAGSDTEERVWIYAEDGTELETFKVARPSDYLLAQEQTDDDDRVVRINRFDTTIQDLHVEGHQGGTLRVGLGVGKVAFGENGMVLAADATGNRMLVYTTDEVVRLHQMVPSDGGPWDVAWDSKRRLAWVSSTETNTVTAYDLSQGVPLEKGKLNTVADAQSLIVLEDGSLVLGSASGDGLQVIDPATVDSATN